MKAKQEEIEVKKLKQLPRKKLSKHSLRHLLLKRRKLLKYKLRLAAEKRLESL